MNRLLDGKFMLVTGATSGMGKVTALRLAEQGASVVIVGRNEDKTQATVQDIQRQAPNSDVRFLVADLSSLAQVRALAQAYQDAYPRLDALPSEEALEREPRAPVFLHLVPAYQEPDIAETVKALVSSRYPHGGLHVVVVTKEEGSGRPIPAWA